MEGEQQIINDHHKILLALSPEVEMRFKSFPCEVVASKVFYNEHTAGYVFNKDSQYRDLFSYHITRIKESGLDTEWFDPQKNIDTEREDGQKHGKRLITLSYNDVISAFVIFGSGCLIAFIYSVVEPIYIKRFAKNENENVKKRINLEKELSQLQVFIRRTNDGLSRMDKYLNYPLPENSEKDHSRIKPLLLDITSMYNKMFDLLEQEISSRQ